MSRMEDTHGTRFELVRHFLGTMFDSDMFTARGQWRTVAVSALALAIPAGCLLLDPPYYHRAIERTSEALRAIAIADSLSLLMFFCTITALLALLAWQSLFPSRRDYLALAGLPVSSRQIFVARFVSVALLGMAIVAAMSALPAVMAPHQFTAGPDRATPFLKGAFARMAAVWAGCLFVFFSITALHGLLLNLLPARWFPRVSSYVQGALIAACFLAGLSTWQIADWTERQVAVLSQFAWAPPVWYAGLQQKLAGAADAFSAAMARRALAATGAAVLAAALMYLLAYLRYHDLLLEKPDAAPRARRKFWIRLLAGDPRRAAILEFLAAALSRSRTHRLVLMAYLGAGFAIMCNAALIAGMTSRWSGGSREILRFAVLYWPIGLSFIALAGVRHAFSMPAELPANWLFQITESQGRPEWMSAVERFVVGCVIAPIHVVTLAVAGVVLGWPLALRMTVFQMLVALMAFEILFHSWQQLPFTCSYAPGKRALSITVAGWLAVLVIVVPAASRIIAALSVIWQVWAVYLVIAAAMWLWLRRRRRQGWGEARLIYQDENGALLDLGIREMTYRGTELQLAETTPEPPPVSAETPPAPDAPVAVALRVCRTLADALPHEFKNVVGEEITQMTEDIVEPTWRRQGVRGLLRLVVDAAVRLPVEYLAEFRRDIRQGFRMLAASPGFTAVALISLSLGIGIAACAYTEVNGLLRNLPGVRNPDELVGLQTPISYPAFQRYRELNLFTGAFAYVAPVPFGVSQGGTAGRRLGHLVTPSYFPTLGVGPLLGRFFSEADEMAGLSPVVVSYSFWKERLGADPSVIGNKLLVNGQPCTIVAVAPEEFRGASFFPADLWLPLTVDPRVAPELAGSALERRDVTMFQMVGRLRAGVTESAAQAQLNAAAQQMAEFYGDADRNQKGPRIQLVQGGKVLPLRKQDVPFFTQFLLVLGALLLLIACANIANMMLARAADRRKEIAVRLAMGASRARLVRQLLTESLLLAACAAPLAFLFCVWVMHEFSNLRLPTAIPMKLELAPDWRAVAFTGAVTCLAGIAFGLAPALQATRTDLVSVLKEGGEAPYHKHRALSLRNTLILCQMAASVMLLVVTGHLGLGIQSTLGAQEGFDPRNLYLVSLDPVRDGYSAARAADFFEKLLNRLRGLPAVSAACITDTLPAALDGNPGVRFSVAGGEPAGSTDLLAARRHIVGRGYFETAGIPILLGRGFERQDEGGGAVTVVVSQEAVRRLWKGSDPVGSRISVTNGSVAGFTGAMPGTIDFRSNVLSKEALTFEVIGVARDVSEDMVASKKRPAVYFPLRPADYAQPSLRGVTVMVRARPGFDAIGAVRREVSALDSGLAPFNARSMTEHVAQYMSALKAASWTYGMMGFFGLVLASVGLAGVTAYSVAKRAREIGIRMALGAQKRDVLALVMKEGAALIAVGTFVGLGLALAGIRALSGFFFTVATIRRDDPLLLAGAPALLAALALVACYVPARRSTRIDPAVTLRME